MPPKRQTVAQRRRQAQAEAAAAAAAAQTGPQAQTAAAARAAATQAALTFAAAGRETGATAGPSNAGAVGGQPAPPAPPAAQSGPTYQVPTANCRITCGKTSSMIDKFVGIRGKVPFERPPMMAPGATMVAFLDLPCGHKIDIFRPTSMSIILVACETASISEETAEFQVIDECMKKMHLSFARILLSSVPEYFQVTNQTRFGAWSRTPFRLLRWTPAQDSAVNSRKRKIFGDEDDDQGDVTILPIKIFHMVRILARSRITRAHLAAMHVLPILVELMMHVLSDEPDMPSFSFAYDRNQAYIMISLIRVIVIQIQQYSIDSAADLRVLMNQRVAAKKWWGDKPMSERISLIPRETLLEFVHTLESELTLAKAKTAPVGPPLPQLARPQVV